MVATTGQARKSCEDNAHRIVGVYDDGHMKVVACLGGVGDWAAYADVSTKTDWQVQRNGDKIRDTQAFELFPWLNPEAWRA